MWVVTRHTLCNKILPSSYSNSALPVNPFLRKCAVCPEILNEISTRCFSSHSPLTTRPLPLNSTHRLRPPPLQEHRLRSLPQRTLRLSLRLRRPPPTRPDPTRTNPATRPCAPVLWGRRPGPLAGDRHHLRPHLVAIRLRVLHHRRLLPDDRGMAGGGPHAHRHGPRRHRDSERRRRF